jgi:hypothetical protein
MRGAVLHKMGLNLVKERVMRRHYGVRHYRPFELGIDPERLRGVDASGQTICNDVMKWYAYKVCSLLDRCTENRIKRWQTGKWSCLAL